MLGLENDKFKIENKVIADKNDLSPLIIDMYDMIINYLNKYNVYCNYLDVEELLYNIEYELTEEEFKVIQKSHCILDKQYEICSREMMNRNKKENRTYIPRKNQNYNNQYYNSQYRNNFQYNEEERTMCSKKRYRSYNQY